MFEEGNLPTVKFLRKKALNFVNMAKATNILPILEYCSWSNDELHLRFHEKDSNVYN